MKLHYLTSLSVGVHTPRRCPYRALLCDHENKRFIVIVLREEPVQGDGRLGKALQHLYTRVWDKSPFSWGDESAAHRVVALEIDWSSIVGIDYRCPLHDDGKLVLEARQVVKRCFKTVEDVRDFYSPRTAASCAGLRRGAFSAAPTPTKQSFDGRPTLRGGYAHAGHSETAQGPARHHNCSAFMTAGAEALHAAAGGGCTGAAGIGRLATSHSEAPAAPGRARHLAPGTRSASASRLVRSRDSAAGAWGVHHSLERRSAAAFPQQASSLGFVSADEEPAGNRRHRSSALGSSAAAAAAGATGAKAAGAVAPGARKRLELRSAGALDSREAEEHAVERLGSRKAATRPEVIRIKHGEILSPRRARSAGDLVSMDADTTDTAQSRPSASGAPNSRRSTGDGYAAATHVGCSHREHCSHAEVARCGSNTPGQQRSRGEEGPRRQRGGSRGAQDANAAAGAALPVRRSRSGSGPGSGSGSGGGGGEDVPRASRWTLPSASYRACTLVLSFRDPFLPQELRRFVKSDLRLLKLYESGLPSWAVLMPSYGLPYRPWMRRALWLVFIAISIFSMGCGFYDLYKNVPFLKQVMTAVASRLYLPAAELFEWLERHTQIRMSILLTYLFSKSPLLVSFMRALRSLAALLQQLLRPAAAALSGALQPLGAALSAAAAGLGGGAVALGGAVWSAAQPLVAAAAVGGREVLALSAAVLGPPARMLWALVLLLAQLGRLAAALLGMLVMGPVQLASSVGGALGWAGGALAEQLAAAGEAAVWALRWAATLGRAARRMAPAVTEGARAAAAAAQAAGSAAAAVGAGGGVGGGVAVWQWLGLEVVGAYNAVRLTFVQAFKSAKAVIDCLNAIAQKAMQHRVSLLLQLRRFITRQKERLPPAVAASVPLPAFVSMPSFDGPTPGPPMAVLMENRSLSDLESLADTPTAATTRHPVFDLDLLGDARGSGEEGMSPFTGDSDDGEAGRGGGAGGSGRGVGGDDRGVPAAFPGGASASGLRRRRVGTDGTRAPPAAAAGAMLHSVSYNRLDAVHEEADEGEQEREHRQGAAAASGPRRSSEPSGPQGRRSRLSRVSRHSSGIAIVPRGQEGKAVRFAPGYSGRGPGYDDDEEGDEDQGYEDFPGPASAPVSGGIWTAFANGGSPSGAGSSDGWPALSSSVPSRQGWAMHGVVLGRQARSAVAPASGASQQQAQRREQPPGAAPPRVSGQRKQRQRQAAGLPPQPPVQLGRWAAVNPGPDATGIGGPIASAVAVPSAVGAAAPAGSFSVLGGAFANPDLVPLARHLRSSSAPLLVRPRSLSAPGDGPQAHGLGAFVSVGVASTGPVPAAAHAGPWAVGDGGGGGSGDAGGFAPGTSAPQCGMLHGPNASQARRQSPAPVEAAC